MTRQLYHESLQQFLFILNFVSLGVTKTKQLWDTFQYDPQLYHESLTVDSILEFFSVWV
jgi:hypothetical protein